MALTGIRLFPTLFHIAELRIPHALLDVGEFQQGRSSHPDAGVETAE